MNVLWIDSGLNTNSFSDQQCLNGLNVLNVRLLILPFLLGIRFVEAKCMTCQGKDFDSLPTVSP